MRMSPSSRCPTQRSGRCPSNDPEGRTPEGTNGTGGDMFKAVIASSAVALVVASAAFAAEPPARILVNAVVLTMDKDNHVAEAIAIDGERIVAVGSSADIKRMAGRRTDVIDLGGRTVIP